MCSLSFLCQRAKRSEPGKVLQRTLSPAPSHPSPSGRTSLPWVSTTRMSRSPTCSPAAGRNPMDVNGEVQDIKLNSNINLQRDVRQASPLPSAPSRYHTLPATRSRESPYHTHSLGGVGDLKSVPMANPPSDVGTKAWQQDISRDLRSHLVHKIVQAVIPVPDPAVLTDARMESVVTYARTVEGAIFEHARSRE
ncbi:hypothetical protein MATL_G00211930 [Megalops atlanticus]|uniref:histone acetyltransferase n=1 Tax=Megalops atlanticus TaxID=7932 RepID=A0A9D3T3P7_MEGAT|nr:hypothetical protein MATL_G00211930 [Megalops atlanticus]